MDPQLLKAVSTGNEDLLEQITSTNRACLYGVTGEGSSALHIAARHGYLKLVEMICDQDISLIEARSNLLDTPLICAARAGHVDVVDYLIQLASTQEETEYVLRAWNSSGATAVHEAVRNGHASVLGKLLSRDARLAAAVDGQGVSPLYMAAVSNRADMVDILIGGNVRSPASYAGPDGLTALHAAVCATNNAQEMCDSLQRWEPTLVQKADNSGRTALHYAASAGKTGVVKVLLVNSSLLCYIPDDDGLYPVHCAAIAGNSEVIREIMETSPSCDELVDKKHRNFLHCAVEFGRIMVVWHVLRRNPKFKSIMNAGDSEGNTPLHLAVKHGHLFIFFLLMWNRTVNLGIINHKGLTPLCIAQYENTNKYSFSALVNMYMQMSLSLSKACSSPSNLARSLRYNHCLEDDKESSTYSDMCQSMLSLSGFIAAGSFAAAASPPGDIKNSKNVGMALSDGESYWIYLDYIGANSLSFYWSAFATWLLIHVSIPTTPLRRRRYYLQLSSVMVLLAVGYMFTAFTSVVQLALNPEKSWTEWLTFYLTVVVREVTMDCMVVLCTVLLVPVSLRIWRTSKHPNRDSCILIAAIYTPVVYRFIPDVIPLLRVSLVNMSMTYRWPGCHDANFLHPT